MLRLTYYLYSNVWKETKLARNELGNVINFSFILQRPQTIDWLGPTWSPGAIPLASGTSSGDTHTVLGHTGEHSKLSVLTITSTGSQGDKLMGDQEKSSEKSDV